MLSQDDAVKLALNGYSKEDIIALGFSFESGAPADNNDDVKNDVSDNKDTTEVKNDVSDNSDTIAELTKTVSELSNTIKAMQSANAQNARENGNGGNNRQSASDVVKDFIKNM